MPAVSQLSYEEGDIQYLSRADHFANYDAATAAPSTTLGEEYRAKFLNNDVYDPADYNNDGDAMPTTGAKNGMTLADLRGADFGDGNERDDRHGRLRHRGRSQRGQGGHH